MNITLKNVPDKVHRTLKRAAEQQGRSLNAQVIEVLKAEVEELERRKQGKKRWKEIERHIASLAPMDDSAPLIREDRESH